MLTNAEIIQELRSVANYIESQCDTDGTSIMFVDASGKPSFGIVSRFVVAQIQGRAYITIRTEQ